MSSTLSPQLQNCSDIFCIEKDVQNHTFRSLVEAYIIIIMRSDRMQLSFWHHWFAPIKPVMRMLNRECRIPWIYEPRLFDFQIHAEFHFQLQHSLTESKHSMDRVEAEINRVKSRPLDHLLEEATNTFKDLQQRTKQEGERRRLPFAFLRHILPASYFHSLGGIKGPKEYYLLLRRHIRTIRIICIGK